MKAYTGKSVNGGIAVAPIKVFHKDEVHIRRIHITDPVSEIKRLEDAVNLLENEFIELNSRSGDSIGIENAELFNAYILILRDAEFIGTVRETIRNEHINAEFAVMRVGQAIANMFKSMEEEYMRSRAIDMEDVADRLTRILLGEKAKPFAIEEPCILVAEDLSPAETVSLDKKLIKGIVTAKGSVSSHTAILARSMDIPAMVCVPLSLRGYELRDGMMAVLDSFSTSFVVEPTESQLEDGRKKIRDIERESEELAALADLDTVTTDGKKIRLMANIASTAELDAVIRTGADGIGLFRSEFLYLESRGFPSEERQFETYKTVLEKMEGKKVVIRTVDIGADKQPEYFGTGHEENPALGFRAIRMSLKKPEIFKTQLRALLRAAVYGDLAVLYPMVTCTWELEWIQRIVEEAAEELRERGENFKMPMQGIMIETPAAVVTADILAKKTEYFSIGTNDLVQYTLAVDRMNGMMDDFYRPKEIAIKRMIEYTVKCAHEAGILCGICGELAADMSMTRFFIDAGIDALSVSPTFILRLKKHIREL